MKIQIIKIGNQLFGVSEDVIKAGDKVIYITENQDTKQWKYGNIFTVESNDGEEISYTDGNGDVLTCNSDECQKILFVSPDSTIDLPSYIMKSELEMEEKAVIYATGKYEFGTAHMSFKAGYQSSGMTQEQAIELIDFMKDYCFTDKEQSYIKFSDIPAFDDNRKYPERRKTKEELLQLFLSRIPVSCEIEM